ncbi:MAG: nitrophenyl compound nitroreductase subunit ArsF family protein [Candidatus Omnitrophota bacterium]
MKKIFCLILLFGVLCSVSPDSFSEGVDAKSKIIAYYFHGSFRCATCTNMERYSKEAIETNFKDTLASGKLEFRPVNVEDKENEHFVNDYQLYTKALFLSFIEGGKEIKSKNLDKIWEYARDKQKFVTYVSEEIHAFLGKTK